jgi:hypothetical protein
MKLDVRVASAGVVHGAAEGVCERKYKISSMAKAPKT